MVVFRENVELGRSGCNRARLLYSGKVVVFMTKVVALRQSGCIWTKVVLFEQSGCIWLYSGEMVVFGQSVCIWAKMVVFGQSC